MSHPIPDEVTALLKVRVNHDLESRDTGAWVASVSVYKALHFQEERIAALTAELREAKQECERLSETIAEKIAKQREIIQQWNRCLDDYNACINERNTLRATVARLEAPVSDEEEYSFSSGLAPTDVRQQTSILMDEHYRFCYRRGLNALIASRKAAPKEPA